MRIGRRDFLKYSAGAVAVPATLLPAGAFGAVTAQTLHGVANDLAGVPLTPEQVEAHHGLYQALHGAISQLRTLPLQNVTPATMFVPVEARHD